MKSFNIRKIYVFINRLVSRLKENLIKYICPMVLVQLKDIIVYVIKVCEDIIAGCRTILLLTSREKQLI